MCFKEHSVPKLSIIVESYKVLGNYTRSRNKYDYKVFLDKLYTVAFGDIQKCLFTEVSIYSSAGFEKGI